ncbi:flagellar motor switch protein FliN [Methylobacter sp. S3L5C]|uniref:flagellar motor switch protein FliN n=1 Tax=Methylobacter sp. S3L5C TaxID=2839024 RepID=UPI001FAD8BC0|nr:flagellar motor switch protein FliN [Methylobacter sp. S3L5C]UOA09035.1 flagellar motor switch protein FliN [Methylobacter sp. S3L5C]
MTEQNLADDDWSTALSEQAEQESTQQYQKAESGIFKDLTDNDVKSSTHPNIDFILDIPLHITVELGRTKILIKNLLQLTQGSIIELDGLAGEPLDVLVNGCLIAHGEVVVVNDQFGIRLCDIVSPADRINKLNR